MKQICRRLTAAGIDLPKMDALEFFAREGDWQTTAYADKVHSLEAWEINPRFEEKLRKNLPKALITIGDSFVMSINATPDYDFIVFDNPMGFYGVHCEHFEALPLVKNLLRTPGIVIFNVNHSPHDIDKQPEWAKRRKEFYGQDKTDVPFLLEFYKKFFASLGFKVDFLFEEKRIDYLSYFVVRLE